MNKKKVKVRAPFQLDQKTQVFKEKDKRRKYNTYTHYCNECLNIVDECICDDEENFILQGDINEYFREP